MSDDDDFLAGLGAEVAAAPPRKERAIKTAHAIVARAMAAPDPEKTAIQAGARARLELVLGEQLAPDPKPAKVVYPPLPAGLHLDIPADRYHADPCPAPALSSSIAKLVLSSPLKAWSKHPKLGAAEDEDADEDQKEDDRESRRRDRTPSKETGTILDGLILGGGPEVVEVNAKSFQTKKAKALRDEALAAGKVPIIAKKMDRLRRAAEAIKINLTAALAENGIEGGLSGVNQATMVWQQRGSGVWCKGRTDHLILVPDPTAEGKYARALILDLKISYDASPEGADRSMNNYDAGMQYASYTDAVETLWPELEGRTDMLFLYCEPTSPWDCTVNRCGGEMRDYGERRWRRAGKIWAECLKADKWPGYPKQVIDVSVRPYLLQQDEEQQLNAGGAVSGGSPGITF